MYAATYIYAIQMQSTLMSSLHTNIHNFTVYWIWPAIVHYLGKLIYQIYLLFVRHVVHEKLYTYILASTVRDALQTLEDGVPTQ